MAWAISLHFFKDLTWLGRSFRLNSGFRKMDRSFWTVSGPEVIPRTDIERAKDALRTLREREVLNWVAPLAQRVYTDAVFEGVWEAGWLASGGIGRKEKWKASIKDWAGGCVLRTLKRNGRGGKLEVEVETFCKTLQEKWQGMVNWKGGQYDMNGVWAIPVCCVSECLTGWYTACTTNGNPCAKREKLLKQKEKFQKICKMCNLIGLLCKIRGKHFPSSSQIWLSMNLVLDKKMKRCI